MKCFQTIASIIVVQLAFTAILFSAQTPTAGLLMSGSSAENKGFTKAVKSAGYRVVPLYYNDLIDQNKLSKLDLLVIQKSYKLPLSSIKPITAYLESGKNIIALQSPMWRSLLVKNDNVWIDQTEYINLQCKKPRTDHIVVDWSNPNIKNQMQYSHDGNMAASTQSIIDDKANITGPALKVQLERLETWDLVSVSDIENPFPGDNTLTVFCAKGSKNTDKLSIEWTLKNETRWIAVIPLTTKWQKYALKPSDFGRWYTNTASDAIKDPFNPKNAVKLSIGLAVSHTGKSAGPHEYQITAVGTDSAKNAALYNIMQPDIPKIDLLSTEYKFHDVNNPNNTQLRSDQRIVNGIELKTSKNILSPFPRAKGTGINKTRKNRWIPIADCYSSSGLYMGSPVSLMLNASNKQANGIIASVTIQDPSFYSTQSAQNILKQISSRMRNGIFLTEGGTDYYTYYPNQKVNYGAAVRNFSKSLQRIKLQAAIMNNDGSKTAYKEWIYNLKAGETKKFIESLGTSALLPADGKVIVNLVQDGAVIDRIEHQVSVWHPSKSNQWISVANGKFIKNGKEWRLHGVNYWPISGMSSEDPQIDGRAFTNDAYDPDTIERDLKIIEGMGFNCIATAVMHFELDTQNLLDFLRRCKNNNLKVMLHPGLYINPTSSDWLKVVDVLKKYRLGENDAIFAYDMCWELGIGDYAQRCRWDKEWRSWIIERYGSIESAESDWNRKVPRDENGQITGPCDEEILNNKPPSIMVAAYRRFHDTLTYRQYSIAKEQLQSTAPNQLASFRMTESGNPTWRTAGITYDFPYFAGGVDFLGPEAWGRIGDWDWVKHASFERPYAKWAAPSLPMVWTEVGVSQLLGTGDTKSTKEMIEAQALYYENWYKVLLDNGGDGILWWWFPGGYRHGENSDYGVINPDGSDRPVTEVIRRHAKEFLKPTEDKTPDYWITFGRNETASTVADLYDRIKGEFWTAKQKGYTIGFKTPGTGTTSANCPLIAVGGNPYNGSNPPEYIDGAFNKVEVMDNTGKWVRVSRNEQIEQPKNSKPIMRITAFNLGEAEWISGSDDGAVTISAESGDLQYFALPHDVKRHTSVIVQEIKPITQGLNKDTKITLSFNAKNRCNFGEKFTFTVIAK